ncbi:hypothetical protein L3X65_12320 [Vibrio diabolicus]|uniref:hypothetical protein n=1 Tax=Vibrio diabolicus TaxID=50719 RepID=UPI00211AE4B3|nr:hypothetical protein [Vibrio diabolicus]MCG9229955.1 hypothetical protein [Vibrio diabolicus]MCG9572686.1 hypothetical protein [Vibrio diabolicus]MCG9593135.1 hypothetical protein [Vibrio diabolicus]MCG9773427.1 hypothetical protein [Vibrio diabolicus]
MNPLDYTFYTLNAKQYLPEQPQTMTVIKTQSRPRLSGIVFLVGFLVGQLVHLY